MEKQMRKVMATSGLCLVLILMLTTGAWAKNKTIKIGLNIPLTGDIPKVGEGSKYAAQMVQDQVKAQGGIQVGSKTYDVLFLYEDNESKAESATTTAIKLITQNMVLGIIGPQSSKQAIPAGEINNSFKTPMISPWSTNPQTTKDRPYVFRGSFLDPFLGPVVANFATMEFKAKKAAVLYDIGQRLSQRSG
jgi:branched-chain amino acid transport system substrate-binding protein